MRGRATIRLQGPENTQPLIISHKDEELHNKIEILENLILDLNNKINSILKKEPEETKPTLWEKVKSIMAKKIF